jgi:hypothetical protein
MLNFHSLVQLGLVTFQEYLRTLSLRIKTFNSPLLDKKNLLDYTNFQNNDFHDTLYTTGNKRHLKCQVYIFLYGFNKNRIETNLFLIYIIS